MNITELYKCLADMQRLRILHLLLAGPLCVCHLQDILDETQVKVSKQLQYLRNLGLVEATRKGKWMFYALSQPPHPLLQTNLNALSTFDEASSLLQADLRKRETLLQTPTESLACESPTAADPVHSTPTP